MWGVTRTCVAQGTGFAVTLPLEFPPGHEAHMWLMAACGRAVLSVGHL